jgi:hypothetical protein
MQNWPRWWNLTWVTASQSHRVCVADSSSSRHLSQMGSSVNPNLKRCAFRWECPVSSPMTHLNWSLFSFNRSFVLLAEGPCISPFACASPVTDSQYFLWFDSSSNRNEYQESSWGYRAAGAEDWQPHRHLFADCLVNVGASMSHNPMGLHCLLQGELYLLT